MLQIGAYRAGSSATINAVLLTFDRWPEENQAEMLRLMREEPRMLVVRARAQLEAAKGGE